MAYRQQNSEDRWEEATPAAGRATKGVLHEYNNHRRARGQPVLGAEDFDVRAGLMARYRETGRAESPDEHSDVIRFLRHQDKPVVRCGEIPEEGVPMPDKVRAEIEAVFGASRGYDEPRREFD